MKTIIRQASIDDKAAIWDFIRLAYDDAAQYKIPVRWNWEFVENPLVDRSGDKLPIFTAIKDGKIAGQICAILSQVKIGQETHLIAEGVDLIVLPVCRGEGVGQRLIEAIAEHYKLYMIISAGEATRRIYDRLKYKKIEPIPIYRKFVKLTRESVFSFLIRKTRNHIWLKRIVLIMHRVWLDTAISSVANLLIGSRDLIDRKTNKKCPSEVREVEEFGDEIDQLWMATCHKFKVIVKRDRRYLNWRFSGNASPAYKRFISTRGNETNGYIVLRKPEPIELNVGVIADLYADPDDNETIENLVRHAIDFFGKNVLAIECPITQKEYQKVLAKLGFFKMEKIVPIFFCADSRLRAKLEELKKDWFLTKGDHDWDQLRPLS